MTDEIKAWLNEQFAGDAETIAAVWGEYVRSMGEKFPEARAALAASDFEKLDRLAHTMKGDALLVGDKPMAEAAIALRDASKAADSAAAAQAIDRAAQLAP